jgi:hypothetical protein
VGIADTIPIAIISGSHDGSFRVARRRRVRDRVEPDHGLRCSVRGGNRPCRGPSGHGSSTAASRPGWTRGRCRRPPPRPTRRRARSPLRSREPPIPISSASQKSYARVVTFTSKRCISERIEEGKPSGWLHRRESGLRPVSGPPRFVGTPPSRIASRPAHASCPGRPPIRGSGGISVHHAWMLHECFKLFFIPNAHG